ncbi:DUF2490 domain-containing protein [Mucilaginibacter sp.]|uniref:DUF2490 domain-containing protein n=1 Tax=Mucilaginibacter sp. TaxID=1882438 RepID=UPI0035BBF8C7
MIRSVFILFLLLSFAGVGYGQSVKNVGWFFNSNTHKISNKFDLLTDVQLRSADRFAYLNTLLLRGALSYNITGKHSVAFGYAYKGDWEHENGERTYSPENRIYEQYLYDFKAGKVEINARFRLEQRFVKEEGSTNFSQRARAFISAQIPLVADTGFTKGVYTGIQNEIFLNVQHKDNVNNSTFDQNRSFVSLGYRFNKLIDAEFGYMYWYQKEEDTNSKSNVWQLMLTTKF